MRAACVQRVAQRGCGAVNCEAGGNAPSTPARGSAAALRSALSRSASQRGWALHRRVRRPASHPQPRRHPLAFQPARSSAPHPWTRAAPVFRPTGQEFADFAYIAKIEPECADRASARSCRRRRGAGRARRRNRRGTYKVADPTRHLELRRALPAAQPGAAADLARALRAAGDGGGRRRASPRSTRRRRSTPSGRASRRRAAAVRRRHRRQPLPAGKARRGIARAARPAAQGPTALRAAARRQHADALLRPVALHLTLHVEDMDLFSINCAPPRAQFRRNSARNFCAQFAAQFGARL